jgi:rubrerythrin
MDKKIDCEKLRAQIPDESNAVKEYNELAKTTDCLAARSLIRGIARDESKHHDMLVELDAIFCK